MPTDNGKVIVSLLAGATAGIVAGLLLAPETGEEAREGQRESVRKLWKGGLGQRAQDALNKFKDNVPNPDAAVSEDKDAADALFNSMGDAEPGDLATPAGNGQSVAGAEDHGKSHHTDL
jgi:hypothetical protein